MHSRPWRFALIALMLLSLVSFSPFGFRTSAHGPVSAADFKPVHDAALTGEGASRGDTAWMIVASALVMLMTPGLAFFYGGLVRSKNVLNTLMMSFVALGIISIQWMLWGYSVAFGPTEVKVAGLGLFASPLSWMGLRAGAGPTPAPNAATIPGAIFMLFQMTFAIITPALISGAVAERMKFGAYCLFILLWATFFYDPLAHMVWDGGVIGTARSTRWTLQAAPSFIFRPACPLLLYVSCSASAKDMARWR